MSKKKARSGNGKGTLELRGKVYRARWMVNGKLYTRSTGTGNRKEAKGILEQFVAPFRLGNDQRILETVAARLGGVKAEIQKFEDAQPAMTIAQAWEAFKASPSRPQKAGTDTLMNYQRQVERLESWLKENVPELKEMRQVSKEQAQAFMAYIGETFTPNTYNKYLAFFRTFWRVLKEDAKLVVDPWEKFVSKPLATHTRRELTVEELARVIASVSGELRVLFAIGIYTGLRLGDAVRLGWGNVDMVKKGISLVPHKTARTGARVYIPLHPVLAQVLAENGGKHTGLITPTLAALYDKDESALSKKIQAVFTACGITTNGTKEGRSLASVDVGFHSLRHTYVSMCANAGVPLSVVQAIVGHGNPAMTEHYVHVSQNALQSVLHALPAIGGADARPEAGNATAGRVGALQEVLDRLGGLDGAELAEVVAKAQELRSEK